MLRHAGVRTKLLAVLSIPTVLLVVATSLLVGNQFAAARKAGQVNALTEVAVQVNRVVHGLQQERSATLAYLFERSSANKNRLTSQRQLVDQQLALLRAEVAESPIDEMSVNVRKAAAASVAAHTELLGARRSIDRQLFFATEADAFYTKVIETDLKLPGVVAESGSPELGQRLRAYEALSATIEFAAHERDLLEIAYLRGALYDLEYTQHAGLVAQQRQSLQAFRDVAPAALVARLDNALVNADNLGIDAARRHTTNLLERTAPNLLGSVQWVQAANSRISPMTRTETQLVRDIADTAAATQADENRQALLFGGVALLGLGLGVILAIGLARRISQPLRRLTVAAGEIGEELPHMVERMQTPGEGPGVEIEPIPVESQDEIGRLAEAFNTVNEVTVRVAQEQAALRASIAEMFVNVARRNQVLLGRQLSQIDQMEAREEDPDVLESLFKLDHLATRMRRNAESLLVLAGIDATRRLRNPLPLSDVIRTAVSEIEAFDRIDLSLPHDPDVSGRLALTTAHLLAELLENATHFSNPETRVVVSAALSGRGVDLTITDYGLGMSEEEIAEANRKIAEPPVTEIAVSQRLGLFVVGRLTQRLGASVTLRRGRSGGTVVTVALPDSVFEGMSRPAPAEPELEPATRPEAESAQAEEPAPGGADGTPGVVAAEAAEPPVEDADAVAAEPAEDPTPVPAHQPSQPARRRRGRLPRRSRAGGTAVDATVDAAVDAAVDVAEATDPADVAAPRPAAADAEAPAPEKTDAVVVAQQPAEAEPEPEAEAEAASDLETVRVLMAEVTEVPQPEAPADSARPEPAVPPAPAAEPVGASPVPQFVFAPAIDVLPTRTAGGRGRKRAAKTPAPVRPATPVAPAPVAAPAPFTPVAPVRPARPAEPAAPAARVAPTAPIAPIAPVTPAAVAAPAPAGPPSEAPVPRPQPARPHAGPTVAADPVPVAARSLPSRAPASEPAGDMERLAMSAQIQADALSELRGLYEPSFAPQALKPAAATEGLARRTPKAAPAAGDAGPAPAARRQRSATEVRGMLSGFRAGVERGRAAPSTPPEPVAPAAAPANDPNS